MIKITKIALILFIAAVLFAGCIEFSDSIILIELQEDGSAMLTVVFSNLSEKRNGKLLTRDELIESMRKECVDKGNASTAEERLIVCEADKSPEILGAPLPSDDRVDGYYTAHIKEAAKFLNDMSIKKGGVPLPVELDKTESSLKLRTMSETVSEGQKSCTYMIRTPWPIKKTNADVVIGSHNLAIWNCTDDKEGLAVEIEAEKGSSAGADKELK